MKSIITKLLIIILLIYQNCAHIRRNKLEILANLAFEHGLKIEEEGACRWPKPQLIYVNDSSRVYMPRATIMHRCSQLYGCCTHSTETCHPKNTQMVDKYFFVVDLRHQISRKSNRNNIKMLTFVNHTSCQCKYEAK